MVLGTWISAFRGRLHSVVRPAGFGSIRDLSASGGALGAAREALPARELVASRFPRDRQVSRTAWPAEISDAPLRGRPIPPDRIQVARVPGRRPMSSRIAYFINMYPAVSHSFI